LFSAKRDFTESVGDIIYSSTLAGFAYTVAMSGAITPSDDPDRRAVNDEMGLESSELNVTMLKEFFMAGGPNMSEDERKRWIASRKPNADDLRVGLINLGTYFGYTLGFAGDIYNQWMSTQGDKNNTMFDAMMKHYTTGAALATMSRTVFKMTPSAQFAEEAIQLLTTSKDYEKDLNDLLANMASAAGASFAPALFGKPLSVSEGQKTQSFRDIDLDREINALPKGMKVLVMAHMRLSRNGLILPGMWRSQFYKAKVGIFGEDLSIRKTMSEPGTAVSMVESMFNFMKLRRNTRVMPKNSTDEARLKFEVERHEKVNEAMTGVLSMASAYAVFGGDAAPFYKMFSKPNKNSFIVTEYGKTPEGIDMDVPITLPNDIFRAEAKALGEFRAIRLDEIIDIVNSVMESAPDGKDNFSDEDIENFKEKLKMGMEEINSLLDSAEKDYQADFLANRANIILKEMNDRGVLSKGDYNKLINKGVDETIFTNQIMPKWNLNLYNINNINFSNPMLYNPNPGADNEPQDEDRFLNDYLYLPPDE